MFRNKHLRKLRTIFVCAFLQVGVLAGVPMRPEEIRELLRQMNAPTIAHVLPSEDEGGDPDHGRRLATKIAKISKITEDQ